MRQHCFIAFRVYCCKNYYRHLSASSRFLPTRSTHSRYNHSSPSLSDGDVKFPSSITFFTDVEGNGDYFDRFVQNSKVLGFRTIRPSFGAYKDGVWNFGQYDPAYFPYDKEVVFQKHDNSMLVYGGDIWDKGGADFYVIRQLLSLLKRYPNRVHFIMGNRDINKLRIVDELDFDEAKRLSKHKGVYWLRGSGLQGDPEICSDSTLPTETAAERLKWMLRRTMGSPNAFELRRQELRREKLGIINGQTAFPEQNCSKYDMNMTGCDEVNVSDEEVVKSYIQSCDPISGLISRYLTHAKLMIRFGSVLFLHGALPTFEANSYPLPWIRTGSVANEYARPQSLTDWIDDLNKFASDQISSWKQFSKVNEFQDDREEDYWARDGGYSNRTSGGKLFGNLLQYGMNSLPDKTKNQTVVYNSWMKDGMPRRELVLPVVQTKLENLFTNEGLQVILSGHQPVGDSPWPIQLSNNKWIIPCDTSFSGDVTWPPTHQFKSTKYERRSRAKPNGRGEVAYCETLMSYCQNTGRLKSVELHGCLSDGSNYAISNLLDLDDECKKYIGRPLLNNVSYIDVDTKKQGEQFWGKAKIDQNYLLSSGKGFHIVNLMLDHNKLGGM